MFKILNLIFFTTISYISINNIVFSQEILKANQQTEQIQGINNVNSDDLEKMTSRQESDNEHNKKLDELVDLLFKKDKENAASTSKFFNIYTKVFGLYSISSKNGSFSNVYNSYESKGETNKGVQTIASKLSNEIAGARFIIGIKVNLLTGRFFIAPELAGTYLAKNGNFMIIDVYERNKDLYIYKTDLKIKGNITFGARFGVNLFKELIALYGKASFGYGFIGTNNTIDYKGNLEDIKNGDVSNGQYFSMSNPGKVSAVLGIGCGFDVNITKHFLLTAELLYDIYVYKVSDLVKNTDTSGIYRSLSINAGIGFRF